MKRARRVDYSTCSECGETCEWRSGYRHYCADDGIVAQAIKSRDILRLQRAQEILAKQMSRLVYGDARRRRWTVDPNEWLITASPEDRAEALAINRRHSAVIAAAWATPRGASEPYNPSRGYMGRPQEATA